MIANRGQKKLDCVHERKNVRAKKNNHNNKCNKPAQKDFSNELSVIPGNRKSDTVFGLVNKIWLLE